ncbi:MAG: tail fiber domain-containing protein [Caulobacteraceae bacterium]|nr:tail fiber domain-containing protein [Caulobacteraceae bacterium]
MPGRLVFSTTADGASSPTERMRIHNDGRISTGTTSAPGASLFGFSINRLGLQGFLESYRNVGNNGQTAVIGGTAGEAYIEGDGDLKNTNNSYGAISDQKLKENIVDASSQWVDIKNLQVRKYNFKPETGYNTHTQIGLIAQEVETVSPGLVDETINEETGESTKTVNYSVLYMKAVKALQEAMERIEALETKVAALETQ